MTSVVENVDDVRCDFDECDSSIVYRVVLAVVDQLGAEADGDLAVLESFDVPLEDCIHALDERRIESASVSVGESRLVVELRLGRGEGLMDSAPLGEFTEVIESFFDVDTTDDPPRVRLSASLG